MDVSSTDSYLPLGFWTGATPSLLWCKHTQSRFGCRTEHCQRAASSLTMQQWFYPCCGKTFDDKRNTLCAIQIVFSEHWWLRCSHTVKDNIVRTTSHGCQCKKFLLYQCCIVLIVTWNLSGNQKWSRSSCATKSDRSPTFWDLLFPHNQELMRSAVPDTAHREGLWNDVLLFWFEGT